MLHARRKRLQDPATQEAAGSTFWSTNFNEAVRSKVWRAFTNSAGIDVEGVALDARELILDDEGGFSLHDPRARAFEDFFGYVVACPDEMMPTVIEALYQALQNRQRLSGQFGHLLHPTEYRASVRVVLQEHRISYDFSDSGELIAFSSKEMHQAVVEPALRLLSSTPGFAPAEQAYRAALGELANGTPSDAITDAGTALQEALSALGCKGNSLGSLLLSARKGGLLGLHDYPLATVLEKAIDWVSADRSEMGDAHKAGAATADDAWLTVHIVGAIVVRLVAGQRADSINRQTRVAKPDA